MQFGVFGGIGVAALVLGQACSSALAIQFSFASGTHGTGYTFAGTAGAGGAFTMTDGGRPNTFQLVIDDNNGPLAPITLPVEFHANFALSNGISTPIAGTLFQHSYRATGTFGFFGAGGAPLLTASFGNTAPALFSLPGSATQWSTSGAVLGSDSFTDVTYTASAALVTAMGGPAIAAQYGITLGAQPSADSAGPDDFAFDLSVVNAGDVGLNVGINATTKAPTTAWTSEGSFSGSAAGGIPTPASVSLFAAAGLLLFRRKR